jgi:uncharacterized protein (DUF1778 family)
MAHTKRLIQIRVEDRDYKLLTLAARQDRRKITQFCRVAILEKVERQEETQPKTIINSSTID